MKILIIASGYPTEENKGHGIFEFDQAKTLVKLGHKVIFVSVDMRSIRRWRKWGIEKIEKDGIIVYGINYPLGRVPDKILTNFTVKALQRLYKKIVKESGKPDIMHAHFTLIGYAGVRLKEVTGIPLVITEHSSQINKETIKAQTFKKAKLAYENTDRLIAVSPSLSHMIKRHFNIESTYIPNIVDLDIFGFSEKESSDNYNFVSVGNLIETKRMDLTIEAFNKAFKDKPMVNLTIFGDGPKRNDLQKIINKFGLNERIKLMGSCPREEIAKQYKSTNCFVLPSQSETFGVAYIEALAMGIPVIASRCGGPEGFINEDNGLMIDVNNKEQLVDAMKYMYENSGKYDPIKLVEDTYNQFSSEIVGKKLIDLYEEVLNNQNIEG